MKLQLSFIVTACAVLCTSPALRGQLTVTQMGGGPFTTNLSTLPTSSAFGKDEIGGGSLPQHKIPNVRDAIYGNDSSWIGDSLNSFIGVSLGATPVSVGQIAFGRDNTGTFFDRTAGTYTIQYTTTPNPTAATPDTAWVTIGTITQGAGDAGAFAASRRHAFNFAPVNATGVRIIAPGSSFGSGAAIDELELAAFAPAPLSLQGTGGTMDATRNIALATNGGVAFAKDLLGNGSFAPTHTIPNLNDGIYGNSNSWIGDSEDSFAGVRFAMPQTIERVAFGRDNTGGFADRAEGYYIVQYTRASNPDASTPNTSWTDIGPVFIDAAAADRALRHEYAFGAIPGVTGLRLITPGNGINTGAAIDELEVYVIPEPSASLLAVLSGLALIGTRRSRRS